MIFKGVRDGKPYPEHGMSMRDWSKIPPRQVRLDQIVTVTTVLELDRLLSEDSTFYGDLFPHVVCWRDTLYLEDGLHRAVRSALRNRPVLHARLFDYDSLSSRSAAPSDPADSMTDRDDAVAHHTSGRHSSSGPTGSHGVPLDPVTEPSVSPKYSQPGDHR